MPPEEQSDSADPAAAGRYHIETWGCQMNTHDAEKLAGQLEGLGYVPARGAHDADVILLNTCAVREKATEKVFDELGRLREIKAARPELILGVCGCVAQQEGETIFKRAPHVDLVLGPRAGASLSAMLSRIRGGEQGARRAIDVAYRNDSITFPFDEIRREGGGAAKAFVTVIEGCNHRCTYCVVPRTRGPETCRDMDHVLDEVRSLVARGVLEVEFLGQTVNAYRDARGRTLGDLLRAAAEIEGLARVRFTTSHPAQMTERLLDAMACARPALCPYLHLPAQSGSSAVLESMRRGYDRDGYLRRIEALHQRLPGFSLGTDLIVGFPTEGEPEFQETLTLLEEIEFDTVYSFTYSPRPGTAALALGDPVPAEVKGERLARLQEVQQRIQLRRNQAWVGRETEVLVEGPSKRDPTRWAGRNPEHRIVHFGGASRPGRLERVLIREATAYSLRGEPAAFAQPRA